MELYGIKPIVFKSKMKKKIDKKKGKYLKDFFILEEQKLEITILNPKL